ncbi:guanylate kinase [Candidatus Methylomirabilis lanthanidiphila]|uniref:Guanylate kinase n=1 Tax=Candidatus Methylomirabilis lanthanidiphila TaxID=2211376 RepID=A0A564ZJB2_9BACT|nr:guanylate kinase [Candidatus Methylomirabilis lanthanidiphila]VUZ85440.1 guanylate kinase [Candidatus Methylomirabilis lanthanidiphila]
MNRQRVMVVVSAPSGAGKTSLCREAARRLPRLIHSVSYTTRSPRPDEQDGRDYHFVNEPTFRRMIEAGEFAEWASVHGQLYGTSRSLLEKQFAEGLDVILDIDTQGAAKLRQDYPAGVFVFVVPPALDLLETRLRQRRTDSEDEIRRRLAMAREELQYYRHYQYIVVNDIFEKAVKQLCCIITAERARKDRVDLSFLDAGID